MNGLNPIKMSLYGKIVNMKVVRLVETVDFYIKIVLIQGRMQPVKVKQGQKQKLHSHFGPTKLIWSVRPSWSENLPESWQCWLGRTEMNQSVRPSWSEKLPKIPVRVRLGFLMFWTWFGVLFLYGKSILLLYWQEAMTDWTTHNQTNHLPLFIFYLFSLTLILLLPRSSSVLLVAWWRTSRP